MQQAPVKQCKHDPAPLYRHGNDTAPLNGQGSLLCGAVATVRQPLLGPALAGLAIKVGNRSAVERLSLASASTTGTIRHNAPKKGLPAPQTAPFPQGLALPERVPQTVPIPSHPHNLLLPTHPALHHHQVRLNLS